MHIQERFDTLTNNYKHEDVPKYLEIAEKATPHLSPLGNRYITVEGYSGTLELDDLAYIFAKEIRFISKGLHFVESDGTVFHRNADPCLKEKKY